MNELKEKIFKKFLSFLDIRPGQRLPWYGIVLRILLFPIRTFKSYFNVRYDIARNCYIIDNHSMTQEFIHSLTHQTPNSLWYKVTIEKDKTISIRYVTEGQMSKMMKISML